MPGLPISRLFLAALLEAVPVVGSVIPGSTVILALSALVPSGELKLQWVLLAAITGAMVGDGSAFWAGHRSQREILSSLAADALSRRRRAERGILQPLGHLGGVLRALRAADPRLRADDGRRTRHASVALLSGQSSRDPALGARACAAGRDGRLIARSLRRLQGYRRQRQASLDADHHRRRHHRRAGGVDHPAQERRRRRSSRRRSGSRTCDSSVQDTAPRPGAGPT